MHNVNFRLDFYDDKLDLSYKPYNILLFKNFKSR
jgi:hypothetical protein